MALVKCPICAQRGHKENMIHEVDKRYYHKEYCHDKWKADKEAARIENQQWDDLYQYIIKLHDIIVLPKGNITRLKDLRAGFVAKDGKRIRQYRTGPDYSLMLEAYVLAEDSVRWCIANKLDGSRDTKAINYGVSIMIDKLNDAFARRKAAVRQEASLNKTHDTNVVAAEKEFVYKKKKQDDDNSFLFQ